jgi:cell division protein FtsQ
MWGNKDKGDLLRRPMAATAPGGLVLSSWDKAQLMLWSANFLYALAAILLLYAVFYLMIHLPVFPLKRVDVKGDLRHVTYQQVSYIVTQEFKGNFFTLDLAQVGNGFKKLPWVRNVSVRRQWPDTLEVTLEEHAELARWADGGLVNSRGELFQAASNSDLPVFRGPEGSAPEVAELYGQFKTALAAIKLKPVSMTMNERRAWQVKLNSGLNLELGRDQPAARLNKFVQVYEATIARMPQPVANVDLRYPNGFAVRFATALKNKVRS